MKSFLTIAVVLFAAAGLSAAEPLGSFDFDQRMMGLDLRTDGEGIVATFRHQRREYALDGELLSSVEMQDAFRVVAVSPSRKLMLHDTHPVDTRIVAWDPERGEVVGRPPADLYLMRPFQFLKEDEAIAVSGKGFVRFAAPSFRILETYPWPNEEKEKVWFQGYFRADENAPLLGVFARNVNYLNQPGGLLVWDLAKGTTVASLDLEHSPRGARISSDGRWYVVATAWKEDDEPRQRLQLIDREDTAKRWDLGTAETAPRVLFDPAGRRLAVLGEGHELVVHDVATREPVLREKLAVRQRLLHGPLLFSPDGRRLYVGYNLDTLEHGNWDWAGRVRVFDLPR